MRSIHEREDELPAAIIDELAKRGSKKRLRPSEAARVIQVGIGRHHFGDHSEACLAALADVASWSDGPTAHSAKKLYMWSAVPFAIGAVVTFIVHMLNQERLRAHPQLAMAQ
jgi:hypothetical protein